MHTVAAATGQIPSAWAAIIIIICVIFSRTCSSSSSSSSTSLHTQIEIWSSNQQQKTEDFSKKKMHKNTIEKQRSRDEN